MSVKCDKFIGYCVDITDVFLELDETIRDKWIADFNHKYDLEYNELNFRPYYNRSGSLKDKITILYDGLCGEYCKLLYVIDYDCDTSEDEQDSITATLNTLLKSSEVPFDIKVAIKKVYKAIFNDELGSTSSIKAEYIAHYH